MTNERGFVLVTVLYLTAILFIVGVGFSTTISLDNRATKEQELADRALYVAEGGIQFVLAHLRRLPPAWDDTSPITTRKMGEDGGTEWWFTVSNDSTQTTTSVLAIRSMAEIRQRGTTRVVARRIIQVEVNKTGSPPFEIQKWYEVSQ